MKDKLVIGAFLGALIATFSNLFNYTNGIGIGSIIFIIFILSFIIKNVIPSLFEKDANVSGDEK